MLQIARTLSQQLAEVLSTAEEMVDAGEVQVKLNKQQQPSDPQEEDAGQPPQ